MTICYYLIPYSLRFKMHFLRLTLLFSLFLGFSNSAEALDCKPLDFAEQAKSQNVLIGRVTDIAIAPTKTKGKPAQKDYTIKILKKLKSNDLFADDTGEFIFPAHHTWDSFHFDKGQLVMFFFKDSIYIKCNYPIVIQ